MQETLKKRIQEVAKAWIEFKRVKSKPYKEYQDKAKRYYGLEESYNFSIAENSFIDIDYHEHQIIHDKDRVIAFIITNAKITKILKIDYLIST